MRIGLRVVAGLSVCLTLGACGNGVDKTLSRKSDWDYHRSLDEAFKDMTPQQQQAFNWAVSNINLEQLLSKYPTLTPRKVIQQEADETITAVKQDMEDRAAQYQKDAPGLKQATDQSNAIAAELQKITASNGAIVKDPYSSFEKNLRFRIYNGSRYGISVVEWDVKVFLNGETTSDRVCHVRAFLTNGLPAGDTAEYSEDVSRDCYTPLATPEVQHATSISFQFAPVISSIEDFGDKQIYVTPPTGERDFQAALTQDKDVLAAAESAKASLQ